MGIDPPQSAIPTSSRAVGARCRRSGFATPPTSSGSAALSITLRWGISPTVTAGPGGTASGSWSGPCGTTRTIRAVPQAGHTFGGWSGSVSGSDATQTVIVDRQGMTAHASFTEPTCDITVTAGPGGSASGSWSGTCGTNRTITATPDADHTFSGWTGSVSGSAASQAVVVDSQGMTAHTSFSPVQPPCDPLPPDQQRAAKVGDEYRWVPKGALQIEEHRVRFQDQTRSAVRSEPPRCHWTWTEWGNVGEPYNGPWPRPARSAANSRGPSNLRMRPAESRSRRPTAGA